MSPSSTYQLSDWREVRAGRTLPVGKPAGYTYADQPYIVKADDGAWVCVVTTGRQHEGESGQHVVSIRSTDAGKTWERPVEIEPPQGPEASYAVLLKTPTGRIYVFYNHNTENIREVECEIPLAPEDGEFGKDTLCTRVDSLGCFVFKYSDDHGKSWSANRHTIVVREFEIDRSNLYGGKIRFFWNVGKAFQDDGIAYIPLIKVGGFGPGFFTRNEGVLLASNNLLTESDPAKICFDTLPDGDIGLRAPKSGGPIAAEHSYSVLSDGSFFVVYRTIDGHPACAYSRDKGHTWSEPQYMTYADGRLVKNPRAANFVWKHSSGYYLYWFHNHGGRDYQDRNPVWLCAGCEVDAGDGKKIQWSEPEIVLYSDESDQRMSYPDMIEHNCATYLTETEKETARIHEIPKQFLNKLFSQFKGENMPLPADPIAQSLTPAIDEIADLKLPAIRNAKQGWQMLNGKDDRGGFSISFFIKMNALTDVSTTVCHNLNQAMKGFCIRLEPENRIRFTMNDGRHESSLISTACALEVGQWNHVVIIVDGGPKIISMIINGQFIDGGNERQFGFTWFHSNFKSANGSEHVHFNFASKNELANVSIYPRALMACEAIALKHTVTLDTIEPTEKTVA